MPEKNSQKRKAKKGLTPYQGDYRTFGFFTCQPCMHDWKSANSWADTAQKCEVCKKFTFPHTQIPLHLAPRPRRSKNGVSIPHLQDSCQKCIQIQGSCTKIKRAFDVPPPPSSPEKDKMERPKRKRRSRRNACKA